MLCKYPIARGRHLFGCGQCLPCRYNRRRVWAHRMVLEKQLWPTSSFVTLTYAPESVPLIMPLQSIAWGSELPTRRSELGSHADGSALLETLTPLDLKSWLKRLRMQAQRQLGFTFRFYAVGEYGDATFRPHYHAALFNFPHCLRGSTNHYREDCCTICTLVRDTWQHGRIQVDPLTDDNAAYCAGYVTKKLTDSKDDRLDGRFPEFARQSRRPGIGGDFMHEVASELLAGEVGIDVPMALMHGGRARPLGQYLRRRLRKLVGRDENTPPEAMEASAEAVRSLFEATPVGRDRQTRFGQKAGVSMDQRVKRFETKQRIFEKRRKL